MKKGVLILTCLFIQFVGYAQSEYLKGFVILENGDTLSGEIHKKIDILLAKTCEFRNEKGLTTFRPENIQSYGFINENRFFETNEVTINGKQDTLFLEFLVDGIVDLYYAASAEGEMYFLKKDNKILPLENKERRVVKDNVTYIQDQPLFRGMLSYAFADVLPTNVSSNVDFNVKSLTKITTKYHEASCDWDCKIYRRKIKNQWEVKVIPVYSIFRSKLEFKDSDQSAQDIFNRYGALVSFTSFKTSYLSYLSGYEYEKVALSGRYRFQGFADSVSVAQSKVCIPLLIKFNVVKKSGINVFAISGLRNYVVVSGKNQQLYKLQPPIEQVHRVYQVGYMFGFGVEYQITDKIGFYLQPYYERESPPAGPGAFFFDSIFFDNLGLTTGISFKL